MCFRRIALLGEQYRVVRRGIYYTLGIDGLIPGGGEAQFFGHPDDLRSGLGPHLVHDLNARVTACLAVFAAMLSAFVDEAHDGGPGPSIYQLPSASRVTG
jgi:hypothetical protein